MTKKRGQQHSNNNKKDWYKGGPQKPSYFSRVSEITPLLSGWKKSPQWNPNDFRPLKTGAVEITPSRGPPFLAPNRVSFRSLKAASRQGLYKVGPVTSYKWSYKRPRFLMDLHIGNWGYNTAYRSYNPT